MTTKKLITHKTDEELLELLEGSDNDVEVDVYAPNDLLGFISVYKLSPGINLVRKTLLHRLYTQWSDNPINKRAFNLNIGMFFLSHTDQSSIKKPAYYCMDNKTEDLIKRLYEFKEPLDKTKYKDWKMHFDAYLKKYDIAKGSLYIKGSVLYNLYDKWAYDKGYKKPMGMNQFNSFCRLYFKEKRIYNCPWYAVDKSIEQHLTEELIEEMRDKHGRKKNNKKIRS
jgi:hypothetical protein